MCQCPSSLRAQLKQRNLGSAGDVREAIGEDISSKRETLELVRAFYKIRKANVRQHILSLVKSVS